MLAEVTNPLSFVDAAFSVFRSFKLKDGYACKRCESKGLDTLVGTGRFELPNGYCTAPLAGFFFGIGHAVAIGCSVGR
jgi:hypothetical protein